MFASNQNQVFRHLGNNENAVAPPKNTTASEHVSKTPASSRKQRRALGDISNRKQGNIGKDISGAISKKTTTPGALIQQQASQQQHLKRNPLSTKHPGISTKKKTQVTFLPRSAQVIPAPSIKILPDSKKGGSNQLPTNSSSKQKSILKASLKNKTELDVEDIEKPAGRLWIEEQDDDSVATCSLPGAWTFIEDHEAAVKQCRENRIKRDKERERQEDLALDEYVASILNNSHETEAMLGADVWIERTISFDEYSLDDLSFDAPSYCADISF